MPELKLIEGRLSEYYNHFEEYEFVSCLATDTRLMGVLALKVTWRGKTRSRARFYQVMHLDYSEYGIDEYKEFVCIPGTDSYGDNKEEMNYFWNHFTGVMGGSLVNISADTMLRLIEMARPLASDDIDREYDNESNRSFREYALSRFGLMKEELARQGITADTVSEHDAMKAVIPGNLATCETINYFVMRVVDRDFAAASMISSMPEKAISECALVQPGVQTLMRSSISKSKISVDPPADGVSSPYRCRITTLARNGYYHYSFVIWLDGNYRSRDPKVSQLEVGSMMKLSDYESAVQIVQPEYITVFQCEDSVLNTFDGKYITPLSGVDPEPVPNGWLYTIYKKDNSHVNRSEYRLNDDVYGYALLTIGGELIMMSNNANSITHLDTATQYSFYAPHITLNGRYLLEKTPVFHTLCHTPGAYFNDLVINPDE